MISSKNINTKVFFENAKNSLRLTEEREDLLLEIADTISDEYFDREKVNINFICTHNSRRSQFAQVWSYFAANYFELSNFSTFSGGTEATAFHRNTVRALQYAGFEFNVEDFSHQNPKYLISFRGSKSPLSAFSKTFENPINEFPYIAITTCDSADEKCPFIPDATHRFHLPYSDPKSSDSKDNTKETYIATSKQIAGEVYFIFEEIKRQISEN
ncbi:arsenate reductase [Tenacibaculum sp. MAR_2009_124]|uniref:hypothetical protein n=1 Tax=Tenacibaculum sp. MAR_2009_124 TaxID=1250059 RepID=UPI000898C343|nr:hypothetical protein [Tenacibaculum sp. MAR_2009_124]SEC90388.1 arsenate reductase [Tenacibaculum sp. MAR_2009_124]